MAKNMVLFISLGTAGFIVERIIDSYLSYQSEENRRLKNQYMREFGMDAPEYLLRREIKDQLNARREMML